MSQPEIQSVAVEMGRCRGHFTRCKLLDIDSRIVVDDVYMLLYKIIRKDYEVEDFR